MTDTHPLFAGIGGHHSARAKTDIWLTPPPILAALGGAESFALDPCASDDRPWPTARRHYVKADNGLRLPWEGRIWLNPPYGPETGRWMARMASHNCGTALIFARTETETFAEFVWPCASALLFIEGRLNFHFPDGTRAEANSGAPSVLVAYGPDDARRLAASGIKGALIMQQSGQFTRVATGRLI